MCVYARVHVNYVDLKMCAFFSFIVLYECADGKYELESNLSVVQIEQWSAPHVRMWIPNNNMHTYIYTRTISRIQRHNRGRKAANGWTKNYAQRKYYNINNYDKNYDNTLAKQLRIDIYGSDGRDSGGKSSISLFKCCSSIAKVVWRTGEWVRCGDGGDADDRRLKGNGHG